SRVQRKAVLAEVGQVGLKGEVLRKGGRAPKFVRELLAGGEPREIPGKGGSNDRRSGCVVHLTHVVDARKHVERRVGTIDRVPAEASRINRLQSELLQLIMRKVRARESEHLFRDIPLVSRASKNCIGRHAGAWR